MLTRRVRGRQFLLRPGKRTNQIIRYVVAVCAKKHNIQLHALMVMSNHWHVCLTDPTGSQADFERDCHSFIARAINAAHGEFESIWSSSQSSRVECDEPDDLLSKIAYTMANPVKAGLVRYGHSWPGVRRSWPQKPLVVDRPSKFFRATQSDRWPAIAVLELSRPPGYDEYSDEDLAALIGAAIANHENLAREDRDAEGCKFLGRKTILTQSRHARPKNRESRFGISPTLACRDKWRRIERLRANKQWRLDYKVALAEWMAGNRAVMFPYGTYKMRVVHGARMAPAPG